MRPLFVFLLAVAVFFCVRESRADEPAPAAPTVDLYTIGPHSDFPSRLGHVVICTREAGHDDLEHGRCFDYGVPESEDMIEVGWTAMRGVPSFRPVPIAEPSMVHFFEGQGRQIEKQRLPLTPDEADKLVTSLDRDLKAGVAYAYHPYWNNCTTKIRDQIDAATNGRLRGGPATVPPGTLREYFEQGHSGHAFILTAMAIYLGEGNDHVPTGWEAMAIPAVLRDGVTERFGAKPEQITERLAVVLETSRVVGRLTIFLLASVLFLVARILVRRNRARLALGIVGGVLGTLALSIELVSGLVKWTEVSHNWALLLFFPTDFALPFLPAKRLSLYLKVRCGLALVVGALEIANVAHQPLLPLVGLVVIPFWGLLGALKSRVATEESAAPADAAKAA